MESELMTAPQIKKLLGIPPMTLYRLARAGEIAYTDVTKPWHRQRHYLFRLEDVEAYLAKRRA